MATASLWKLTRDILLRFCTDINGSEKNGLIIHRKKKLHYKSCTTNYHDDVRSKLHGNSHQILCKMLYVHEMRHITLNFYINHFSILLNQQSITVPPGF